MYAGYFGLSENPFNLTPDQKYLFLSHHHNEALYHLLYGIHEKKGFIAISGGVGTGKTTLCRALLNRLGPSTRTALVFNTAISDMELLETINQEFGITRPGEKASEKDLLDRLYQFLLENHKRGINSVLILDEAQNLTHEPLERLRMLSNLETEKEKLLQIVFLGQPELIKLLKSSTMSQLNERITVRYTLQPLGRREVGEYIDHRLTIAGNRNHVRFTKSAIKTVFSQSKGNPRRINAICDRALLIAYCKNEFSISKNTIQQAVDNIGGHLNPRAGSQRVLSVRRYAQIVTVVALAAIIANFSGWSLQKILAPFFVAAEKITAVQARAFLPQPDFSAAPPVVVARQIVRKPVVYPVDIASYMMDEQTSMSTLLKLFDVKKVEADLSSDNVYPGIFSFKGDPTLYREFVRPFRTRIKTDNHEESSYVLIAEVTPEGVVVMDADGVKQLLSEEFLLTHWDGEISWVYPYENNSGKLKEGMSGVTILKMQQMLQKLGYHVEPKGVFDRSTFEEVLRFQLNQGLRATGVVGTPTKALLYQLAG